MAEDKKTVHPPDYGQMKKMLDYIGVCYWLIDLDLKILDINETFLNMTGASKEKLVGRDILTLVLPEEQSIIEDVARRMRDSKTEFQFEFYVIHGDKKTKTPMMFHLIFNRDASGRPVSCNVLLSDISLQKSLEDKERRLFHAERRLRQEDLKTKMIGTGKAMEDVFYTTLRCAEVDTPVLITGETGVGKEVTARLIHSQSARRRQPFVAVNCGALPGDLLESELFGHVKGAFTGAGADRPGLFREAEGGTLFLDEIGDIEKRLQVKLLRALQANEIRPVGDDNTYKVNLRIICATNRDLLSRCETGEFRQDLYYRISVVTIHLPPLRERPEDIMKLAGHFIEQHPEQKRFTAISDRARKCLDRYRWPGNIRELQNAVEHAMVMSREKVLRLDALPTRIRHPGLPRTSAARLPLCENERAGKLEADKQRVMAALEKFPNSRETAARSLGISRVTLWRKIKRYGICGLKR